MSTSPQNPPPPRQSLRIRILLASAGSTLLLSGIILLILSARGLLPGSNTWLNVLGPVIVALGTGVALFAWLFPLTPLLRRVFSSNPAKDLAPRSAAGNILMLLRQDIERDLNPTLRTGVLVVVTRDQEVAHYIKIIPQLAWVTASPTKRNQLDETHKKPIERYRVDKGYACVAIFRDLDPGDYIVRSDANPPRSIPIFPNEVTILDLR